MRTKCSAHVPSLAQRVFLPFGQEQGEQSAMSRLNSEADVDEVMAYVQDMDDAHGSPLFHPDVTRTILRAIAQDRDFVISLRELAEWLGQQEKHIKGLLPAFKSGEDYRVAENASESRASSLGGRPKGVNVLLTMDCAKRLALRSRGRRAEQVRTYFIQMEQAHRGYLQRGIRRRLAEEEPEVTREKLRREAPERRPNKPPGPGVYVFERKHQGRVTHKVGKTVDVNERYRGLRRTLAGELRLRHWEPTGDEDMLEACVKTALQRDGEGHEIFSTPFPDVMTAMDLCKKRTANVVGEFERRRRSR